MYQDIIQKNGFIYIKETRIEELDGTLLEIEHAETGAKVVWLNRNDDNMTFSIGFRTIPTDSTGVFHILEHSVLGGSEKYPVKEPFLELLKSSLQTFLNAMTFPDKTVYPVSSRNHQDFLNLMSVYMDAVLHPLAVRDPLVFRQEGWRVEFPDNNDSPVFQGVVYNEMKGALSNVRNVTSHVMMSHLFPDSCYMHESGGNPKYIPDLTFEQFKAEHAKYYHPSNARIAFDGSIDLDQCLSFLDNCFKGYSRQELDIQIPYQNPLPFSKEIIPYEIGPTEDPNRKTIVSYGKILCDYKNPVEQYAAEMLADYLSSGSEAPLRRAILDSELAEDAHAMFHDGLQQCWFGWEAVNTKADCAERIFKTVQDCAVRILEKGLDRDRLLGCYNSLAFRLMDRDNAGYPRGLSEVLSMDPWYYGGDPAQNLSYRKILKQLRDNMETNYFENLLQQCLLDNETGFLGIMIPSKTLADERIREEREHTLRYWNSLNCIEQQNLRNELELLHSWQQSPNAPEMLDTIPTLELADIDSKPAPLNYTHTQIENTSVLSHCVSTDLHHLHLFFDADDLQPEELPIASLLGDVIGLFGTKQHTSAELQVLINQKIGDTSAGIQIYPLDREHHRCVFYVQAVCLPEYASDAVDLLTEILNDTSYCDRNLLRERINQHKIAGSRRIVSAGSAYALSRVKSRESSAGAARELIGGFENICWTHKVSNYSDAEYDDLLEKLHDLSRRLFVRQRLLISLSSNAVHLADRFIHALADGKPCISDKAAISIRSICREGIRIPAAVGFAAAGTHLQKSSIPYSGSMNVLSNYLTYEYLWNSIRVKGGAYGTDFGINSVGDVSVTSFRDPSPFRSILEFKNCAQVIESFAESPTDLTKFIIGAISDVEPLLGNAQKIQRAEARYFRQLTSEASEKIYQQLLNTSISDLISAIPCLQSIGNTNNYCIVAGDEQLSAHTDQLDVILDLPS